MRTPSPLLLKLQINTRGSWRDVMTFDDQNIDLVMIQAEMLFKLSIDFSNKAISARIIKLGETAPVLIWAGLNGWAKWRLGH
jgi:hypothetical protein